MLTDDRVSAADESRAARSAEFASVLLPSDEGRRVVELEEKFWQVPAVGTTCYAIDYKWWQSWCAYTGVRIENRKLASVVVSCWLHQHTPWQLYEASRSIA